MDNKKSSGGGLGITGVLTIIFIVLKILKIIDWNWFWVLSPMIFDVGIAVLILAIFGIKIAIDKWWNE